MRTLCLLTLSVLTVCLAAGCGSDADDADQQTTQAEQKKKSRPTPPPLPPYGEGERAPREYLAKRAPRETKPAEPRKPDPRFDLDETKWVKTQDNLSVLGKAVLAWRQANGSFPRTLQELVDAEKVTVDVLSSPSDGRAKIVYRSPPTAVLEDDWILLYDPIVNGGKYQAFMGNGTVAAIGLQTLESVFAAP